MGWMIIGIIIAIIAIAICCYFFDYSGTAASAAVVAIIASIVVFWNAINILDARTDVYYRYQYQYEQYVSICDEIKDCEDSNMFENEELMKKIRNYNADMYKEKNETFINKYTHNQRFKDLEYIEIEGLAINPDKNVTDK